MKMSMEYYYAEWQLTNIREYRTRDVKRVIHVNLINPTISGERSTHLSDRYLKLSFLCKATEGDGYDFQWGKCR